MMQDNYPHKSLGLKRLVKLRDENSGLYVKKKKIDATRQLWVSAGSQGFPS